ncbi:MAG TPA: hypothetical protein VFY12_12355, partial [Arenimonas sp.]|nr:hypothetical protein [Arenimonas sp.]
DAGVPTPDASSGASGVTPAAAPPGEADVAPESDTHRLRNPLGVAASDPADWSDEELAYYMQGIDRRLFPDAGAFLLHLESRLAAGDFSALPQLVDLASTCLSHQKAKDEGVRFGDEGMWNARSSLCATLPAREPFHEREWIARAAEQGDPWAIKHQFRSPPPEIMNLPTGSEELQAWAEQAMARLEALAARGDWEASDEAVSVYVNWHWGLRDGAKAVMHLRNILALLPASHSRRDSLGQLGANICRDAQVQAAAGAHCSEAWR